ncbi:MAG: hypothetical protein JWM93_3775 [Frankiales bacterium]|nr:hypothetical protein [Frankiales bacterium]
MSPEEAARRLREEHPLTADRVQRVVALLLSVGSNEAVTPR